MKKEMKIKKLNRGILRWSDVEGANDLKVEFDRFNRCIQAFNHGSYFYNDKYLDRSNEDYFYFADDLIRNGRNKPYFYSWLTMPEQLKPYVDDVVSKMNSFISRGYMLTSDSGATPKWNSDFDREANNMALEVMGYASYNQAFKETICFDIEENEEVETVKFKVCYGDLIANQKPYFSTTANSGQGQDRLLPKGTVVRAFWEKWDIFHLSMLTRSEYEEMLSDLEIVKADPLAMNEEV